MQILAAIYIPDFPAAAAARAEPELREQALAMVDGTPPLMRVIAVNQYARAAEVEIGMTQIEAESRLAAASEQTLRGQAARIPRGWQLRRRAQAQEQAAQAALIDCACAFSPRVEAAAVTPDTVVLDLDGLERLFGPPAKIARELAQRAAALGLEAHVAVAGNIDAAIYAARGFAGITIIPPGEEAARLGALPVELLLAGEPPARNSQLVTRNAKFTDTLARWGIHTFRALAALPETAVRQRLGEAGVRLQKLARGEASRPLVPAAPPLKFEETIELEHPIVLLEPLALRLSTMLEQLCARLAARALATQEIRLSLGLEGSAAVLQSPAPAHRGDCRPVSDRQESHVRPTAVIEYALHLPVPMMDAKVFLKLLHLELCARPPAAPVEKIFLAAAPILPRFTQGGLFLPATPEPEKLEVMLARARQTVSRSTFHLPPSGTSETFATASERVGTAKLLDTYRPDAFRINPAFPSVPHAPSAGTVEPAKRETRKLERGTILRRYRPPQPVRVEVKDGQPVNVLDFQSTGGMRSPRQREARNVVWASGPWRESGEWWTPAPWSREVWDMALREDGHVVLVRAFHDTAGKQWFVEALYD